MKMPLARPRSLRLVSWAFGEFSRAVLKSCVFLLPVLATAAPNVPPTVAISSAVMRPGITLMDVTYQITDPDDATVKVRALAFVDGIRSFANVIRPVTWAEGTEAYIGDTITPNVNHTLTWDVAADWNIQLGQVKFEVLAVDSNGILPFQGITIPAAAGQPELTINQVGLTDPQVFNALLWFYALGNAYLEVANGTLVGSATSGVFRQRPVVEGAAINQQNAQPFLFKLLNISPAGPDQLNYADTATRTTFARDRWLTTDRPYISSQFINGWGNPDYGQRSIPELFCEVTAVEAGYTHTLVLKSDGTVVDFSSYNGYVPAGLSGVRALTTSKSFLYHVLALMNDGTVVGWGENGSGQATIPAGLSGVTAISAGVGYSLALKNDGTVVAWGYNHFGQAIVPPGLSGVTAISAGAYHCIVLAKGP
jgi:hypothetical protein